MEQFKAGKRTVFEVLDSRMVIFTMQKNAVNGRYEQLRAAYGIYGTWAVWLRLPFANRPSNQDSEFSDKCSLIAIRAHG